MSTEWTQRSKFPFPSFSKPLKIAENEFVIAASKTNASAYYNANIKHIGLYKYNMKQDKWIAIFPYDKHILVVRAAAIDRKQQLIYLYLYHYDSNKKSKIIISNLKARQMSESTNLSCEKFGQYPDMIVFNDELHIIGGKYKTKTHFICNNNNNKLSTQTETEMDGYYKLIQLRSEKHTRLLSFGAGSIYEFSNDTKQWENLEIKYITKIPKTLYDFGIAVTRCGTVIICGGKTSGSVNGKNNIFVYDVMNKTIHKSKIKCPRKGSYEAIITNNTQKEEKLTFGFILKYKYADDPRMAYYLKKLISMYVNAFENIHLIQANGCHWTREVNDILDIH